MEEQINTQENETEQRSNPLEGLLWFVLIVLSSLVVLVLVQRNWDSIQSSFRKNEISNFDQVAVRDFYNHMSLTNGQSWEISYETGKTRSFAGLVRHVSAINEPAFSILTFDILVTSGDYADETLVQTSVQNHHFSWFAPDLEDPQGKINLLHTVPANEEINTQLSQIKNGDTVILSGYEIYRITGFDPQGNSLGYWQDSGCNTTLITDVKIIQMSVN